MHSTNVRIERLPAEAYLRKEAPVYRDVVGVHTLFDSLCEHATIILSGHKGTGKSLAWVSWAVKKAIPLVTVDCSEGLRENRLLGAYTLRGNETPFILGPIPTAIDIANETGACILNFEELNSLSPAAQKLLNPITDFRKRIEVPEAGRVYEVAPGKKLIVGGSMNTANYAGTYQLNEDLLSRVEIVTVDYPDKDEERQIVEATLPKDVLSKVTKHIGSGTKVSILDGVLTLASETRQSTASFDYALAPRDVVQILHNIAHVGVSLAMQLVLGKYTGDARRTIKRRIESIFVGVALPSLPEDRLQARQSEL